MNARTNQVLLAAAVVLLAAVVALLTVHLFRPAPATDGARAGEDGRPAEVIRARCFELVNNQGKVVAQLHVGEQGGGNIRLRSVDGTVRVKVGATDDGSSLLLFDTQAEPAVELASNRSGTSATLAQRGKQKKVLKP